MVQTYDTRLVSNTDMDIPSGFDGGNTDTAFTALVSGQEKTVIIPSTVMEVDGESFEDLKDAVAKDNRSIVQADMYHQDISIEYNNRYYLVGYSAMKQSKIARTQKGDNARYYSEDQLVRLLAASALATQYAYYSIRVVTTVPFEYYSKQLRKSIRQNLSGVFKFKINGQERQATIDVKNVVIEGTPAFIMYGEDSAGTRRLIIDGGGYTTEFMTFDGMTPVAEYCKGVPIGVENIAQFVATKIAKTYNRRLTTRERSEILRAFGSYSTGNPTNYPEIMIGATNINPHEIHALCTQGAKKLAEETLKEAASLWGSVNDIVAGNIRYQYHIGGSVHFISSLLREQYMPNLAPISGAEKVNAEGCARIARAMK